MTRAVDIWPLPWHRQGMWYTTLPSPLGPLLLVKSDAGLAGLYMEGQRGLPTPAPAWQPDPERFASERRQLDEYFAGERTTFELVLAPHGTPFQHAVWQALQAIPFGATRTYGELAAALGSPGAARAVGAANGRNPLGIVVPCHRVIGRGGALTGYAAGEERKRWLLDWERSVLRRPPLVRPDAQLTLGLTAPSGR